MDIVWQKTAEAIREVMDASGIDPSRDPGHRQLRPRQWSVRCWTVTARHFAPASPPWIVARADIMDEWNRPGACTTRPFRSSCNPVGPAQPRVLLAWLKRHEPESYRKIGKVMMCTDYIKYCLTGVHTTDFSIISGSSLFDSPNRGYSPRPAGDLRHPRDTACAAAAGLEPRDRRPGDAGSRAAHRAGRGHAGRRRPVRHRCRCASAPGSSTTASSASSRAPGASTRSSPTIPSSTNVSF